MYCHNYKSTLGNDNQYVFPFIITYIRVLYAFQTEEKKIERTINILSYLFLFILPIPYRKGFSTAPTQSQFLVEMPSPTVLRSFWQSQRIYRWNPRVFFCGHHRFN